MVGVLKKRAVTQVVANLVVITSPLVRLYSIHNSMQALILHVILVKVLVLAMKRLYNKQKYDALNGYYTLIMSRNMVDVAQQAVKDYQGHVTNVEAQYNVGF